MVFVVASRSLFLLGCEFTKLEIDIGLSILKEISHLSLRHKTACSSAKAMDQEDVNRFDTQGINGSSIGNWFN
ncbi:MAG: hypothetical protein ACI83B_002843 [Sediminicola sp.]|jgi:hypothetical protein